MPDIMYKYQFRLIVNRIDDTIIADSNTIQILGSDKFCGSSRKMIRCQTVHTLHYSVQYGAWYF